MNETIYLAAGCFWGVQEKLRKLNGVVGTEVGYMGGETENPTYEEVCAGDTKHAESVKVVFDTDKINIADVIKNFWEIHDPTTLNKQGPDVGDQYRSAIFTTTDEQQRVAEDSKENAQNHFSDQIVTVIEPAGHFYRAEEYHQCYIAKRNSEDTLGCD